MYHRWLLKNTVCRGAAGAVATANLGVEMMQPLLLGLLDLELGFLLIHCSNKYLSGRAYFVIRRKNTDHRLNTTVITATCD